jgi:hypothetical protein
MTVAQPDDELQDYAAPIRIVEAVLAVNEDRKHRGLR